MILNNDAYHSSISSNSQDTIGMRYIPQGEYHKSAEIADDNEMIFLMEEHRKKQKK
jgi:hypothetical protein